MASGISIQVGALTRTYTASATDAQVGEALRNFAFATGAATDATNAELADHVLRELVRYMVQLGRRYRVNEQVRDIETETEGAVSF